MVRWPWQGRRPSEETMRLQERLKKVEEDDKRVANLARRRDRIIKGNDLAEDIMRALGVHR